MVRTVAAMAVLVTFMAGCADTFLQTRIDRVETSYGSLSNPAHMRGGGPTPGVGTQMVPTVNFAMAMADAYAAAARDSMMSQDLASAVILASSAWAGAAVFEQLAEAEIARRVIPGVAAQTVARRGVNQASIQALYRGAMQHNCVAMVGSLYTPAAPAARTGDQEISAEFAAFVMVLVMREIEYRTFQGRARTLADFSTLTGAFTAALEATTTVRADPPDDTTEALSGRATGVVLNDGQSRTADAYVIQRNPALERFFLALSGCLATGTGSEPAPNLAATPPT